MSSSLELSESHNPQDLLQLLKGKAFEHLGGKSHILFILKKTQAFCK